MSILSTNGTRGITPFQILLPLAAIAAGTLAGVAVVALARRTGVLEREVLELAPDGTAILFDKGGVTVIRDEPDAPEAEAVAADLAGGRAAACGIRPTFEVEAALERELATEAPADEPEPVHA